MTSCKLATKTCVSAIAVATAAFTVEARSLLYYYDFDKIENNTLVYQGVNKGSGMVEFTFKQNGAATPGYVTSGAFGSGGAFCASTGSSLWLGSDATPLGCNTTVGFTMSFWLKTSPSHNAWTDFFGFRVAGYDYRCEYTTGNTGNLTMYYSSGTNPVLPLEEGGPTTFTQATAGTWKHVAFVFTPNSTNNFGTCSIYIGGEHVGNMKVVNPGNLQQIHVGSWVRASNNDRKTSGTSTCIDELAVFDYPATAEQVKWLAKFKPAQPADGPARAMPIAWLLDTGGDSTGGIQATNYGTGTDVAYKWLNSYANWVEVGAFGSTRAFHLNNNATFRVDGASATEGLGASLLSGMTLSFWIKAPASTSLWRDFMSFRIGNSRYERFEWCAANPMRFTLYGAVSAGGQMTPLDTDTWQNVCMTWNSAESKMEFYLDGVKTGMTLALNGPTDADVLKSFTIGCQVFNNTGGARLQGGSSGNVFLDEVAIFNHSFSPAQIQWLTNNVPCLPPLDSTNLVRTVSENGVWFGKKAVWGVREWDDEGGAWRDSGRTTLYPSCEDLDVEAELTLADGVTLSNDTFVTPRRLALVASAADAAATLAVQPGSLFAPQALEVGEGLQLTVPLYAVNVEGALTLGAGSKITFDTANFNDGGTTEALTAGSFVLPEGETDVLAHFAVTDNRFTLSLSADGKKVLVAADAIPATAVWTGASGGTSLGASDNWECRNISGAVIPGALPCEFTRVIVSSGAVALNAPAGTTIPWPFLRIEAGSVTLADDADWCGLGALSVPEGVTVDLAGKKLHLIGQLENTGTITSSEVGGELHVDVPSESISANASVAFTGSLKLVKDGEGTFVAARTRQTYTGGTFVAAGTLRLGTELNPLGAKNALVKVGEGALYDMGGFFSTSTCIYCYDLAGTFHLATGNRNNGYNAAYKCIGSSLTLSGDATMTGGGFYFANPDGTLALTMNGHTLTFEATSKASNQTSSYVGMGAIRCSSPGTMKFIDGMFEWLATEGPTNVDMVVRSPAVFKLGNASDRNGIGGLVYDTETWDKNNAKATLLAVYGTYLAGSMRPPMVMMDGSTIDLSEALLDLTGAYVSTTANIGDCAIPGEIRFADGAAIYMKLGNRSFSSTTPLIRWPEKPANIEGVTFKNVAGQRNYSFEKRDDGLYAQIHGFSILVR